MPLSLSSIASCVPDFCCDSLDNFGTMVENYSMPKSDQKKSCFVSCEEFVELLKQLCNSGLDEDDVCNLPERSPPEPFCHRPTPCFVVWNLEGESGQTESQDNSGGLDMCDSTEISPPDFDFYERESSPKSHLTFDQTATEEKKYVQAIVQSDTISQCHVENTEENITGSLVSSFYQDNVTYESVAKAKKVGDLIVKNERGERVLQEDGDIVRTFQLNFGDSQKGSLKELEGMDCLPNDMRNELHLEGKCNSNEDLRGKPGTRDLAAFDHLEKAEDSDSEDLPLGAESCGPIPLKRSQTPARPVSPPATVWGEKSKLVHLQVKAGPTQDNLEKLKRDLADIPALKPSMEDTGSDNELCLPDVPETTINLRPRVTKYSEYSIVSDHLPEEADLEAVTKPSNGNDQESGHPGGLEVVALSHTEVNSLLKSAKQRDFLLEDADRKKGLKGEREERRLGPLELLPGGGEVEDDNEDARSIASVMSGVDHLDGVTGGQVTTAPLLGHPMALHTPCIDEVVDVVLLGNTFRLSKTNSVEDKMDTLENEGESIKTHGASSSDVNLEVGGLRAGQQQPEKASLVFQGNVEPDIHLQVPVDGGSQVPSKEGSSSIISSSSFIESFAANVQAIYEDKTAHDQQEQEASWVGEDNTTSKPPVTCEDSIEEELKLSMQANVDQVQQQSCGLDRSHHDGETQEAGLAQEDSESVSTQDSDSMCTSHQEGRSSAHTARSNRLLMLRTTMITRSEHTETNTLLSCPQMVDIAVEDSHGTDQQLSPGTGSELTPSHLPFGIDNTGHRHRVVRAGDMHFVQSHCITLEDVLSLVISCFDLIFWVGLALAVLVFEAWR